MAEYIAAAHCRFDRQYAIGERIPDGIVDPNMERKLIALGKIVRVPIEASAPDQTPIIPVTTIDDQAIEDAQTMAKIEAAEKVAEVAANAPENNQLGDDEIADIQEPTQDENTTEGKSDTDSSTEEPANVENNVQNTDGTPDESKTMDTEDDVEANGEPENTKGDKAPLTACYTEAKLMKTTQAELRKIAEQYGIQLTTEKTTKEIVATLITKGA